MGQGKSRLPIRKQALVVSQFPGQVLHGRVLLSRIPKVLSLVYADGLGDADRSDHTLNF
jgi:hypothetical protein